MKKRCIAVVLAWVLFVSFLLPFREKAHATDPITLSQIGAITYAIGNSTGLGFLFGNATGVTSSSFIEKAITKWLGDDTIAEKFGSEAAKIIGGKLIVPFELYNGIIAFLADFIIDNKLSEEFHYLQVTEGNYTYLANGIFISNGFPGAEYQIINNTTGEITTRISGTYHECFNNGIKLIDYSSTQYVVRGMFTYRQGSYIGEDYVPLGAIPKTLDDTIQAGLSPDYVEPTVLNPDKSWSGYINGQDIPDTNLDQLIGDLYGDVADNNLSVEGEIIDYPPVPTPVPTWTPVDDVIDGINQTGELLDGIGNDIGDISGHLDDMGDQIDGIEQSLDGVQEGIQTQTGVISGALDQAAQDVVEAIGEQTTILDQTLTGTAESVQDIADALEPGQITLRKFDLRRLFPFCIPFDIHNLLQKFDAEPVAPHVQLPFVIQSIGFTYMIDLDFSAFDPVAAVLRTVEFIVFAIGLAWATSKVIKW